MNFMYELGLKTVRVVTLNKQLHFSIMLIVTIIMPPYLQERLVSCAVPVADLATNEQTRLLNRDERVRDLADLIDQIGSDGIDGDAIYELQYWVTMADSAYARFPAEFPDCAEYQTLETVYATLLDDMYALATQVTILYSERLTEDQQQNVLALLQARGDNVRMSIETWIDVYEQVQDIA